MSSNTTKEIKFHYIKSSNFRVIPASGVWGGVNPRGLIDMTFFTERSPIPTVLTHSITSEGQLGEEIARETKDGLVRDVHVSIVIDLPFAKSFRDWLEQKIDEIENISITNPSEGDRNK
ncbi:MAG: hypothetical protein OXH84_07405 [Gammaproteobacteria bacterium]|nr:hypothetical protein [Gammaproteobacteria bacterium]